MLAHNPFRAMLRCLISGLPCHNIYSYILFVHYFILFGTVVAFAFTLLMRFFAAVIIWLTVLLCAVGALAGTGFCW
jgi:hypothetical protein